jgi:RPA family protein
MKGLDSFTRVYASELSGTGLVKVGLKDGACRVITPTGACCGSIFVAGALLEIDGRANDRMQARVADPTGAFTLEAGRQERDVPGILSTLQPPVFVTAVAEIQCPGSSAGSPWRCALQDIREVSREVRDTWVVTTAEQTLSRLEAISFALEHGNGPEAVMEAIGFYRITRKELKETALTIRDLLAEMESAPGVEEMDITQVVLALIRDHGGDKGITLEEIIRVGSGEGLSPGEVRKAVDALLAEDECYQPSKGTIRLL